MMHSTTMLGWCSLYLVRAQFDTSLSESSGSTIVWFLLKWPNFGSMANSSYQLIVPNCTNETPTVEFIIDKATSHNSEPTDQKLLLIKKILTVARKETTLNQINGLTES